MLELLRNWNFWMFAVAIASLVRELWPTGRATLDYMLITYRPVFSIRNDLVGNVEVRYRGQHVEALHVVEFVLLNTGSQPLRKADFEGPLVITLPESSRLLDVDLLRTYPGAVNAQYWFADRRIEIAPLLLNSEEAIALRVFVEKSQKPWQLGLRVAGVRESREVLNPPSTYRRVRRGLSIFVGFGALLILLGMGCVPAGDVGNDPKTLTTGLGSGIVMLGLLAMLLMRPRSRFLRARHRLEDLEVLSNLLVSTGAAEFAAATTGSSAGLSVVSAVYGVGDRQVVITDRVRAAVNGDRLDVEVSNSLAGGDPAPNVPKELRVEYRLGDRTLTKVVPEGQRLTIP